MTRNIKVEKLSQQPVEEQMIELVERKGIGHPDSIADGLAESISCALCHEYKKRVGAVLHHNTDETQVVAGRSRPAFGGGEIIQPIYVLLSGRATRFFGEEEIPVDVIARRTARRDRLLRPPGRLQEEGPRRQRHLLRRRLRPLLRD